jgi:hypothetical protein
MSISSLSGDFTVAVTITTASNSGLTKTSFTSEKDFYQFLAENESNITAIELPEYYKILEPKKMIAILAGFAMDNKLQRLQGLKLGASKEDIDDGDLERLSRITHLTTLDLGNCRGNDKITPDGLESIAKLEYLRELNLSHCKRITPGLQHLSSLKELTSLKLNWIGGEYPEFDCFDGDSCVAEINPQIQDRDIHDLGYLVNLKTLEVDQATLKDRATERFFIAFPKLSHLSLSGNRALTKASLKHLSKLHLDGFNILNLSRTALKEEDCAAQDEINQSKYQQKAHEKLRECDSLKMGQDASIEQNYNDMYEIMAGYYSVISLRKQP